MTRNSLFTTRQVRTGDGVTLTVDIGGDPSGPGVALLHGGGQTRHAWRDSLRELAAAGYRVAAYDLRGHGDSEWATTGYALNAQVGDLRAVLALLPERPALIGASLGGLIALTAVGESPHPLAAALVLVDVAPTVNRAGEARIIRFMRSNPSGFRSLEEAADAVAAYLPHRPRPNDLGRLRRNLRQRGGRWYWHWDPQLFDTLDAMQADAAPRYQRAARALRLPTLLVRGSRSEVVDAASVDAFRREVPHAHHVDVRDAHHMVAGDRNSAFNAAVVEFLDRSHAATSGPA